MELSRTLRFASGLFVQLLVVPKSFGFVPSVPFGLPRLDEKHPQWPYFPPFFLFLIGYVWFLSGLVKKLKNKPVKEKTASSFPLERRIARENLVFLALIVPICGQLAKTVYP